MYIERRRRSAATPATESKLTASLAHEINNPLDSVLNLLYLVQADASLSEEARRYLKLAAEEVQRVARIAQEAMIRSKAFAVPEDVHVPGLIDSVIEVYRPRFEARGISVCTRYGSGGNHSVYSAPLRQVFSNVLLNAADSMPKGGRLHARTHSSREWSGDKRHGIRVTFADTGCGISAQNLVRIFDPFFTTKGAGGSGLGLSLVRDVVQRHNGWLRVRSSTKPGRSGSVLTMFLPSDQQSTSHAEEYAS